MIVQNAHGVIEVVKRGCNFFILFCGISHKFDMPFIASRYVRVLGAFYLRLTGTDIDVYRYLEPLYNDYRKLRHKSPDGRKYSYDLSISRISPDFDSSLLYLFGMIVICIVMVSPYL